MASSLLTNIVVQPYHATLEIIHLINQNLKQIARFSLITATGFALASSLGYYTLVIWYLKWIGLGILSSVGFGFGLESFMWGMGTAIGELPPYLAARLRSQAIGRGLGGGDNTKPCDKVAGWELWMIRIINKVGFIGILLCAAIPNPLFDAAGVASGIAQVPFLTFFGATFIGKAMIKVFIQSAFVIFTFHNNNLDLVLEQLDRRLTGLLPTFGSLGAHQAIGTFLQDQRTKVLSNQSDNGGTSSPIASAFEWLIRLMMTLFVISVINALHKQYIERKERQSKKD